jgi:PKD repeat protein/photosystem II stability/assembly factor-like uncharacterized protein
MKKLFSSCENALLWNNLCKKLFALLFLNALIFSLSAQYTIENFESIKMNIFGQGSTGTVSVIPNPDPTGINTSAYVGKMVRAKDGDLWQGWYCYLPGDSADAASNRYVHIKIWKTRLSRTCFKMESGTVANTGDVFSTEEDNNLNQWFEVVFDFSEHAGKFNTIVLIPDFPPDIVGLADDIELYWDDIYLNDDPTVGSAPVQMLEDYEPIALNLMYNDPATDSSKMTVVPNPYQNGLDLSSYVCKFQRDKDGSPWGGFWSALATPVDVTGNKFVHVKVWKPRISPVKFKLEGGASGTLEIESTYPQTKTNEWEDMVFDFSSKTGTYPIIAFMPDFIDPVNLAADETIYFDDIVVNSDPLPMNPPEQVINVDMSGAGLTEGEQVFISGNFEGIYGLWAEPGTNINNEMFDADNDGVYTITMHFPAGSYNFKFFKGTTWASGDPASGGDRSYNFINIDNISYKWGVEGLINSQFEAPSAVVKEAASSPVIDGFIDEVWNNANTYAIDRNFIGETPTLGDSGTTTWKALWNNEGIFILVQVNDDVFMPNYAGSDPAQHWMYDKPEIYFDVNKVLKDGLGPQPDENGAGNGHYHFSPSFVEAEINGGNALTELGNGSEFAFHVINPGYVAEYYVPFTKLLCSDGSVVKKNSTIGFDVTIIDNDVVDTVRNRAVWSNIGIKGESWVNMDDCGIITLENAPPDILVSGITVTSETGFSTIETDNGTLKMIPSVLPENASVQNVKWSVISGTGRATISADGTLTAKLNGTVTVRATAMDDSGVFGEITITISNQNVSIFDASIIKEGDFPVDGEIVPSGQLGAWQGWTANGGTANVISGVCKMIPGGIAEVWYLQVSQKNFQVWNDSSYILTFTAWADQPRNFIIDFDDANNGYNRFGASSDPESTYGRSEWLINVSAVPAQYTLHVTFDQVQANTDFVINVQTSGNLPPVYMDNIAVVSISDTALIEDWMPYPGLPEGVIKKAVSAPVIDGNIDAAWSNANVYSIDKPYLGENPTLGTSGQTNWRALWDDNGIYILLQVTDDAFMPVYRGNTQGLFWMYDRPEIYFDVNPVLVDGGGPSNMPGHLQVAPSIIEAFIDGTAQDWGNGIVYAFKVNEPDYTAEYFIPYSYLLTQNGFQVSKAATIGFDVTIGDCDVADPVRNRAVWANTGLRNESWYNMDGCGTVTLEGVDLGTLVTSVNVKSAGDATSINTDNGTLQMTADISPANATDPTILWSVQNVSGKAEITPGGLLTAKLNGTVIVNALTKDGSYISNSKVITITNQVVSDAEASEMVYSIIGTAFYYADGVTPANWDYDIDLNYQGTSANVSTWNLTNFQILANGSFKIRKDHAWAESWGYNEMTILGDVSNFAQENVNIMALSGKVYDISFIIDWNVGSYSINLVPVSMFAGGSGTKEDPFLVSNANQLNNVRTFIGAGNSGVYFSQTADIELGVSPWNDGEGWLPIGDATTQFFGHYNGNGHSIKNISINRPALVYVGLFGWALGADLENINLQNVNIIGSKRVGALAGKVSDGGYVSNCNSSGNVTAEVFSAGLIANLYAKSILKNSYSSVHVHMTPGTNQQAGGLIARVMASTVENCYAVGQVDGLNTFAGGLIAIVSDSSAVTGCFAAGDVSCDYITGGLIGNALVSTISNCYATGSTNGIDNTGGLVGSGSDLSIMNCYATGYVNHSGSAAGGLVGSYDGTVSSSASFWNLETTGSANSGAGEGKTTLDMITQATFNGWPFGTVWNIYEGTTYPYLLYQTAPGGFNYPPANIPPSNLAATPGDGNVRLDWTSPSIGIPDSYNIYRDGVLLGSSVSTSFMDSDLTNYTNYTYLITAVYGESESGPSNPVIVHPLVTSDYLAEMRYFHPTAGGSYPDNPYMHQSVSKPLKFIESNVAETWFGIWSAYNCWITINEDNSIGFDVSSNWANPVYLGDPNDTTKVSHYDPETGIIYLYYYYEGTTGNRIFWEEFTPVPPQPPSGLNLSNTFIPFKIKKGTVISSLSVSDLNSMDTHTLEFVPGFGDNSYFEIQGNLLVVAKDIDLSAQKDFMIKVRVTDNTGFSSEFEKTINANSDEYEILNVPVDFIDELSAINENVIWVQGQDGRIARTIDGGLTWDVPVLPEGIDTYGPVFAISNTTAWFLGSQGANLGVFKTTNGGQNWTKQTSAYNETSFPDVIYFWNANEGFTLGDMDNLGYIEIYTTSNGGQNWTRVSQDKIAAGMQASINDEDYMSVRGDTAWVSGTTGYVYRSTDKGHTWNSFKIADVEVYGTIEFFDGKNGVFSPGKTGTKDLYLTQDGGVTWSPAGTELVLTQHNNDFSRLPGSGTTAMIDVHSLYFTNDHAGSWSKTEYDLPSMLDLQGVNDGLIYAGGYIGLYKIKPSNLFPCDAEFSWNLDASTGQSVFTSNSLNGTVFYWSFGDGYYSAEENPVHTFKNGGTFTVCLTVINEASGCQSMICHDLTYVPEGASFITADFTFYNDPSGNTVNLFDNSSENTSSWYWITGDGKVLKQQNPVYTYSKPGIYEVCLIVFDLKSGLSNSICKDVSVGTLPCELKSDFTYFINPESLEVVFSTDIMGDATDYFWTFGDGSSSTMQNPAVTYNNPGYYQVTLAVMNTTTNCLDVSSIMIQVGSVDCHADFKYRLDESSPIVYFEDKSRGDIDFYYWEFGDGGFSTIQNPEHTYKKGGVYLTGQTVIDNTNNCADYTLQPVQAGDVECSAGFKYYVDASTYTGYFTNDVIGESSALLWSFGDGRLSTQPNPVHVFPGAGIYSVGLNTFDVASGCMDYFQEMLLIGDLGADCEADFAYVVTPDNPEVIFNNRSIGDIVGTVWNFGDGSDNSLEESPSHTYLKGGYYNVCLSVVNSSGIRNMSCKWVLVSGTTNNDCRADFMYTIDSASLKVNFVDKSFGNVNKFTWDFGDTRSDSVSKIQNPEHTYSNKGYYLVQLTAENTATGCVSDEWKLLNVAESQVLKASFAYIALEPDKKVSGYPVDLVAASSGDGSTVEWDFGDKQLKKGGGFTVMDSTGLRVTHYYEKAGKYNVCVRISDPVSKQSDTYCQAVFTKFAVGVPSGAETGLALMVYPNPFVDQTTITWILPSAQNIELAVYDQIGRRIETLEKKKCEPGLYKVTWNSSLLSPGVYHLKLITDDQTITRQLVISK